MNLPWWQLIAHAEPGSKIYCVYLLNNDELAVTSATVLKDDVYPKTHLKVSINSYDTPVYLEPRFCRSTEVEALQMLRQLHAQASTISNNGPQKLV